MRRPAAADGAPLRLALLAYGPLLRLLPPELRREAAGEMRETCRALLEEARRERGARGLLGRWAFEAADLLLLALRLHARALVPHGWRAAARPAALALPALAAALLLWPDAPASVVFSARDPAGEFSLTLRGGRVVAGSLDRVPLPPHRLLQAGDSVRFLAEDGSPLFSVRVEGPGTIRWEARPALARS